MCTQTLHCGVVGSNGDGERYCVIRYGNFRDKDSQDMKFRYQESEPFSQEVVDRLCREVYGAFGIEMNAKLDCHRDLFNGGMPWYITGVRNAVRTAAGSNVEGFLETLDEVSKQQLVTLTVSVIVDDAPKPPVTQIGFGNDAFLACVYAVIAVHNQVQQTLEASDEAVAVG